MLRSILSTLTGVALVLSISVNAADYTISFDDEPFVQSPTATDNWGTIIDDEYTSGGSVGALGGIDVNFWVQHNAQGNKNGGANLSFNDANTFNANKANGFLALFNSNLSGTQDPDLEVNKDNLAIIHERNSDCNATQCGDPDDRYIDNGTESNGTLAARGGFIFIQFSQPVNLHSIDLADIEDTNNQRGRFRFYDAAGVTVKNGNKNWTNMVANGNSSYATQTFDFADSITTMVIRMQGSGGIKNLAFQGVQVPEPTTLAIFGIGLIALIIKRKKV